MGMTGIEAVEEITRRCYRGFSALANGELIDTGDVYGVVTDVPLTFFNGIATTRIADGDAGIERVRDRYRRAGRAFRWWVTPSVQPADLAARLAANGFRHVYDCNGMSADLSTMHDAPHAPGLVIRRARSREEMEPWAHILVSVFHLSANDGTAWLDAFTRVGYGDDAPWAHFVGLLDGTPVATTSLMLAGDLAGVYHVATMPEARGRGLGAALTHHAMLHAREGGAERAVLQSSEMGYSVYRSLGFVDHCPLALYDWRPGREAVQA
jgi:ribosomal protein S18 acetylase RimI-like enzyme